MITTISGGTDRTTGTVQYFDRSTGTVPTLENETYSDNENSQKIGLKGNQ